MRHFLFVELVVRLQGNRGRRFCSRQRKVPRHVLIIESAWLRLGDVKSIFIAAAGKAAAAACLVTDVSVGQLGQGLKGFMECRARGLGQGHGRGGGHKNVLLFADLQAIYKEAPSPEQFSF